MAEFELPYKAVGNVEYEVSWHCQCNCTSSSAYTIDSELAPQCKRYIYNVYPASNIQGLKDKLSQVARSIGQSLPSG